MPQIKFTDRKIASLPVPEKGQVDYFDLSTKGFGVRISQGGTRSWFLKYVLNKKQWRWRFGEYPAMKISGARKKALEGKHDVMHGINPAVQQKIEREALTFKELADRFIEEHGKVKKRTWPEDERILGKYFAPFHDRKANDIHRLEISSLLQTIRKNHGGIMANRALPCVRAAYNFGIRNGYVNDNPAHMVDAPVPETSRDRVHDENELRALWEAFDDRDVWGSVFKLCLCTGQRLRECARLSREEIDGGQWNLPGSRTKNGLDHVVPLSDLALEVIEEAGKRHNSKWIFRSPRSTFDQPVANFSRAAADIKKWSGVADFHAHDLRRSFSTEITGLGFPRFVVDRLLNHAEPGVGGTYDRYDYSKEKIEAMNAWTRRLRGIVGLNENVVQLARKKA